jgi:hypothetical protein
LPRPAANLSGSASLAPWPLCLSNRFASYFVGAAVRLARPTSSTHSAPSACRARCCSPPPRWLSSHPPSGCGAHRCRTGAAARSVLLSAHHLALPKFSADRIDAGASPAAVFSRPPTPLALSCRPRRPTRFLRSCSADHGASLPRRLATKKGRSARDERDRRQQQTGGDAQSSARVPSVGLGAFVCGRRGCPCRCGSGKKKFRGKKKNSPGIDQGSTRYLTS